MPRARVRLTFPSACCYFGFEVCDMHLVSQARMQVLPAAACTSDHVLSNLMECA